MLIPLWLFTLMVSLIVFLSISTYYLIGFLMIVALEISIKEMDDLRSDCYKIISDQSLYFWEKIIINKLIKIIDLIEWDQKIFQILSSWPAILVIMKWGDVIICKRLKILWLFRAKKLSSNWGDIRQWRRY